MRYVLPVATALTLAGCGDNAEPPELCTGAWSVCGGHLRDGDGRAIILRGMNVGKKEPPYFDFHAEADFARMRTEWGMNAMRFYVTWAAVEPTQGAYDDVFLDGVRMRLDWAGAHGIDVILDLHQDVYGEGFGFDGAPRWTCDESRYAAFVPSTPWPLNYLDPNVKACFDELWTDPAKGAAHAAVWRHIAERLGDHPAVIGFDVINEPHWGNADLFTWERDLLQPFYDRDVAAVRAVAPHWVAFLEPGANRNLGFPTSLVPFAYDNVVYAPHAYDAAAEQEQGFDDERRQAFIENIAALRVEADTLGTALWIGEYGGLGTDPGIGPYMDAAYDGAAAVNASSMYWAYSRGGGYSPLDSEGNEITAITDAIVRPYPSRIAGTPVDWSHDEVARTFTLRYRPDERIVAPTVIIVPARFGQPLDINCGDCAYSIINDRMHVNRAPTPDGDGIATVMLAFGR